MTRYYYCLLLCVVCALFFVACQSGERADSSQTKSDSDAIQRRIAPPEVGFEIDKDRDLYTHKFSRLAFPAQVGALKRDTLALLTEDGCEISATYSLPSAVSLVIHLTPIAAAAKYYKMNPKDSYPVLQKYYAGAMATICEGEDESKRSDDAKLLSQTMFQIAQDNLAIGGLHAEFEGWLGNMKVGQSLYLVSCNDYFVSFEATWPWSGGESARKDIDKFLQIFRWPASGKE